MENIYIEEIETVAFICFKPSPPQKFTQVAGNLNRGNCGKNIYLCVKRTSDPTKAVTHIDVLLGNHKNFNTPPGYTKVPQDLNGFAGGKFIYLCYAKNTGHQPISDLSIMFSPQKIPNYPWIQVEKNCNEGTCGRPLYVCYRRHGWESSAEVILRVPETTSTTFSIESTDSGRHNDTELIVAEKF